MITMNKRQRKRECEEVHEIYEGLNLRQMEHLLWLISDRIEIPHAFNDGVVREMEIESVVINGGKLGIITDQFKNHCDNMGKNE
tara:strand:+ start:1513 stop:1764 length:252 start_codon:yes stop_codon:yes gene_type:complete